MEERLVRTEKEHEKERAVHPNNTECVPDSDTGEDRLGTLGKCAFISDTSSLRIAVTASKALDQVVDKEVSNLG